MAAKTNDENEDIISGINITPFVDVTLVLLIIFMVTATCIVAQSIPVDLPEAATGEDVVTTLAVTVTRDGEMHVDGKRSSERQLKTLIRKTRKEDNDVRVIVAADAKVIHGKVVRIIDLVRQLGVSRFAINIDTPKNENKEIR
jgi:biopolymer transport protein ExbD